MTLIPLFRTLPVYVQLSNNKWIWCLMIVSDTRHLCFALVAAPTARIKKQFWGPFPAVYLYLQLPNFFIWSKNKLWDWHNEWRNYFMCIIFVHIFTFYSYFSYAWQTPPPLGPGFGQARLLRQNKDGGWQKQSPNIIFICYCWAENRRAEYRTVE